MKQTMEAIHHKPLMLPLHTIIKSWQLLSLHRFLLEVVFLVLLSKFHLIVWHFHALILMLYKGCVTFSARHFAPCGKSALGSINRITSFLHAAIGNIGYSFQRCWIIDGFRIIGFDFSPLAVYENTFRYMFQHDSFPSLFIQAIVIFKSVYFPSQAGSILFNVLSFR